MSEVPDMTKTTTLPPDDSLKEYDNSQKSKEASDSVENVEETEGSSESFVTSALNSQGSVNYRNAAWKPTPPVRQSSLLSLKSNSSGRLSNSVSSAPGSPITKSPTDQQAYLQAQFIEIFKILKDCHIDEDILLRLKE